MQLIRSTQGVHYDAPKHSGIDMSRLAGAGALTSGFARVMHLRYEAAGTVELSASADEKIYYCIRGEVEISDGITAITLRAGDMCIVAPGEPRQIVNRAEAASELLLIMARQ